MPKRRKSNKVATGFFLGAAIGAVGGAVAGILTAPKSGKATRADIARHSKKAVSHAKKTVKKATKRAKSTKKAKKTR